MSGASYVQLEPTTRCNFTCGFCCGRHMPQEDLDWDTFQATLDAFPELEHVELQGEGESLLHKQFLEMVEALRARDVKVSFICNGSLLHAKTVDRLLDAGVDKISISIESPDAEAFREIRGGKLDKVVRNVRHLMDEKRRRGLDRPVVGLSITVLERTKDDLPGILALYRDLGLDGGVTLQPLQQMESYAQHYGDAMQAQALSDDDVERIWLAFFANAEVRRIEATKAKPPGFYDELMAGWRPALGTCPYLERGLYVDRRGRATPCCMIKDTEQYGLGTVGVDPPATILANRQRMADELRGGTIPTACGGCEVARFATMSNWGLLVFGAKGAWNRWVTPWTGRAMRPGA